MRDVLIALVPALLGSIYFFGFRALLVTLVSAAACVFFEWGFCKIRKLHCKTYDLSAVVTGVLLAFRLPRDHSLLDDHSGRLLCHRLGEDALRRPGQEHRQPRPCRTRLPVQLAGAYEQLGQGRL